MPEVITNHIDLWTSALLTKSSAGRGSNGKLEAYGINKLRDLILKLAIMGKLIPQADGDESTDLSLSKARAKLRSDGKGARRSAWKETAAVSVEEQKFELPNGWVWARVNDTGFYVNGLAFKPSDWGVSGRPIIRIQNLTDPTKSLNYAEGEFPEEVIVRSGDLLVSWSATLDAFVWDRDEAVLNQHIFKVTPCYELVTHGFLYWLLKFSIREMEESDHAHGLVMTHINREPFLAHAVAIPPLAEQDRIVAKVDELMALCDQLEQQQTHSHEAHQTLVETLLGTLTRVASPQELNEAWTRIANHFDTLFTTEHSIDQLKQTILQLAVMGKLVFQDPSDEAASVFLDKIADEKERLIKEGQLKKEKPLPPLTDEEKAFPLPHGWAWVKFGVVAEFINGDRSKNYPNRSEYVDEGVAWINTGHIEPNGRLTTQDMNFISREKFDSLNSGKIQKGDLVYCLRGATFGKTAFVEPYEEGAIASSLMIIRPFITGLNKYIFQYLVSPFGKRQLFRFDNGSAQPNLSAGNVMLYAFPLPPLAEQHRIVAKVDELMALCDALKVRIKDAQTTQIHLADAIVEQAVA